MEQVRLGKTGLMVSQIGFGGIPIQRLSEERAVSVIRRCLDLGVNFLDTAINYTVSEGYIGKAIAGRQEGLILASKSTARDRQQFESHVELSLNRLGVSSIDLYQFHGVNDFDAYEKVMAPQGPIAAMEEGKRTGKIRHIGITTHSPDVGKEAIKSGRFETIMFPFNFVAWEPGEALLHLAQEQAMGFIAMKPMAGGQLEDATLAFKYLLQFPGLVPVVGVEKEAEIEEIVQIADGPLALTEAEKKEIERMREELGTQFCRRCGYCQPCPEEIPISVVTVLRSSWMRLPAERFFTWELVTNAVARAENCTDCGECEQKCPYKLPIREMIKDAVNFFTAEKQKYEAKVASRGS